MMKAIHQHDSLNLGSLLKGMVGHDSLMQHGDIIVSGLVHDSRKAKPGDLFVAYHGHATHGLLYAVDAVNKGVNTVLWGGDCDGAEEIIKQIASRAVCIYCDDLREKVGEIASRFYAYPSSDLNMIGVTGTDGKTSITHFVAQCLDRPDDRCGILGTLGNGFIGDLEHTGMTTADALDVHQSLNAIRECGATRAVMEVSSHGLDQGRINAVYFDTAVFSNFSQDHLDYHETLEKYAEAKSKLFSMPGLRVAVINLDDAFGLELAEKCKKYLCVWGYSMQADVSELKSSADFIVHARSVEALEDGFNIKVKTPKGSGGFSIRLMGSFNVSNVLATLTTLLVSNIHFDDAITRLAELHPVAGRMETTSVAGKPVVIIDYAHTPKGLEAACRAVKQHYQGALWCVFGCGGDRDKSKRPLMAAVAEQFADRVVVTSDNPRHEDPQRIIDDVMQGFNHKAQIEVIIDRRQAIDFAISQAGVNDVVLLAGKGHESSQIVGDVHIAFDDRSVARHSLGVAG